MRSGQRTAGSGHPGIGRQRPIDRLRDVMATMIASFLEGLETERHGSIYREDSPLQSVGDLTLEGLARVRTNVTTWLPLLPQVIITQGEDGSPQNIIPDGQKKLKVPPGADLVLCGKPQVAFRPCKLVVVPLRLGADLGQYLDVNYELVDILVGKNSQSASMGSMPLISFLGFDLMLETVDVAQDLKVVLRNTSNEHQSTPRLMFVGQREM